jgi:hypothetical protein
MLKRDHTGVGTTQLDSEITAIGRLLEMSASPSTSDAVRQAIALRWGSKSVDWQEFHVRPGDLPAAFMRVIGNSVDYPFGIQGTVRRLKNVVLSKGKSYVLELRLNDKRPVSSDQVAVSVNIWASDEAWLEQCKPGCEIIAFGHWVGRFQSGAAKHSPHHAPYLSMWLSRPSQLFAVEEPDAGTVESAGSAQYAVSTSDLAANQLRFLEPRHKREFSRFVERLARYGPSGDAKEIATGSPDVLVTRAGPDLRVAFSIVDDQILVRQVVVKDEANHG